MRSTLGALVLVPALALVGACSAEPTGGGDPNRAAGAPTPNRPRRTAPDTQPDTEPDTEPDTAPSGATACDEVVAGIDDFNLGDFEGTVRHFENAVPLAEAEAQDHPSRKADDLLEAVRYYAELAPEDYSAASLGSADFEKYKQITLGQCVADGPPPTDDGDDGVLA